MTMYNHDYQPDEPHTGLFHWYLEHRAATRPDEQAYTYSPLGLVNTTDETGTWSELNEEAGQLAGDLADNGVKTGDFIATLFPPSPHYAVAYFAAAKLGATLVPLDLRGTPTEHQYVLDATSPAAFIGAGQFSETDFKAILNDVPAFSDIKTTYWLAEGYRDSLPDQSAYQWTTVDTDGAVDRSTTAGCTDPDTALLVVFTSGTTGDPKGAVLTHRNVVFQGTAISSAWNISEDDTVLVHLPMDHVGGSTELMGSAIVGGSELVFLDAFDPSAALAHIEAHDVSVLGNVPAMWGMLFNNENYSETDLSSLRVGIVAGQAPSNDILQGMADAADTAVTGWGLTETGGFVTLTDPDTPVEAMLETVGRPFPGFDVRPIDDNESFLSPGETGELVVRGDGVMDRFLADEHNKDAFVKEEWVRTGDLGLLDDDGRVQLRGRKKNMYISGGYNVYPPEIEDTLTDHPEVAQAMVIGVHDAEWGEAGYAFILARSGSELDQEALEEFVEDRLADYKRPVDYTIASELPLTSLGKIDRQALLENYELDPV